MEKRPTEVTVAAILLIFISIFFWFAMGLGGIAGGTGFLYYGGSIEGTIIFVILMGIIKIISFIAAFIIAYGLIKGKKWGWKSAISLGGVNLFFSFLYVIMTGCPPTIFEMICTIIFLGLLLAPNSKHYFSDTTQAGHFEQRHSLNQDIQESKELCPNCKKPIQVNWVKCPYCKTDLSNTNKEKNEMKQTCKNCGKPVEPSWIKCPYCNTSLKNTCPNCGKQIDDDWKTCPYCSETLINVCEKCGKELKPEWKTCPFCSNPINKKD